MVKFVATKFGSRASLHVPCILIMPSNYLIQPISFPAYIYQVNLPIAVKYTHTRYSEDDYGHLPKSTRLSFCLIPGLG